MVATRLGFAPDAITKLAEMQPSESLGYISGTPFSSALFKVLLTRDTVAFAALSLYEHGMRPVVPVHTFLTLSRDHAQCAAWTTRSDWSGCVDLKIALCYK